MGLLESGQNNQKTRDEIGQGSSVFPKIKMFNETISVEEGPTIIEHASITGSAIYGSPTFGIYGTSKYGSSSGGTFILGHTTYGILGTGELGSGSSTITFAVINPNRKFIERFGFDYFEDPSGGSSLGTPPTSTDCVAYWKMEDTSDSSGNGNTLTPQGCTSGQSGKIDDCYSYDGTNDYMTTPVTQNVTDFSISFWYSTTTMADDDRFFWKGNTGAANSHDFSLFNSSGVYDFRQGFTSKYTKYTGGTIDTDGNWVHVMVSVTSNVPTIYINGSSIALTSGGTGTGTRPDTGDPLIIAAQQSNLTSYNFPGKIDEFSFFDVALTSGNAEYLYNSGNPNSSQQFPFLSIADWDTSNQWLLFIAGETAQSLACYKNSTNIINATFTCNFDTGDSEDVVVQLSSDGGLNWETVTIGTQHTFTDTGTDLRFKVTASDVVKITWITITYND